MGRTKGSKNRAKTNKKAPLKLQKSLPEENSSLDYPERLCTICNRVAFGNVVPMAFNKFRHADCALGSVEWNLYYQSQSIADRKVLSEFYNYHKGVNYD